MPGKANSHPMFMPPNALSASDHISNCGRCTLTSYIVDVMKVYSISADDSVDPKVGDPSSHAMLSMPPKDIHPVTSHQLRDINSPPVLWIPPEAVSGNDHAWNCGRSGLTYCVPNGSKNCISQ